MFNTVTELCGGPGANLRYVTAQGLSERGVGLRHPARRGRARRAPRLGRRSASAPLAARCGWRPGSPGPGSERTGDRRLRRQRLASTSTSTPPRSTPRRTRPPTSPSAASSPDRSTAVWRGMITRRPRRAADRRLPGEPQPAALQARARRRDPGPRDPRQRRALHARRGDRPDRPEQLFYLRSRGLSTTERQAPGDRGLPRALVERFEEGPIREAISGALERRLGEILTGRAPAARTPRSEPVPRPTRRSPQRPGPPSPSASLPNPTCVSALVFLRRPAGLVSGALKSAPPLEGGLAPELGFPALVSSRRDSA